MMRRFSSSALAAAAAAAAAAARGAPAAARGVAAAEAAAVGGRADNVAPLEDARGVLGVVHSLESMSAVDGPGLRYLVFLQGCQRRCAFCSNPDTWQRDGTRLGQMLWSSELEAKVARYGSYLRPNGGGVTCSGGEPLVQARFVVDLFDRVQRGGLTTCLDTAGLGDAALYDAVLERTDLTLLCAKSFDAATHFAISKVHIQHLEAFIRAIDRNAARHYIRYVFMPGSPYETDSDRELDALCAHINGRPHCLGVEILPYHSLGKYKWASLGVPYPFQDEPVPTSAQIRDVRGRIEARLLGGKKIILA